MGVFRQVLLYKKLRRTSETLPLDLDRTIAECPKYLYIKKKKKTHQALYLSILFSGDPRYVTLGFSDELEHLHGSES